MKTPWRFLADLVSRRQSAEPANKPSGIAKALEYHPSQEGPDTSNLMEGSLADSNIDGETDAAVKKINFEDLPAGENAPRLATDAASLLTSISEMAPEASQRVESTFAEAKEDTRDLNDLEHQSAVNQSEKKAKGRGKPAPSTKAISPVSTASVVPVEAVREAPKTAFEEMMDLDREIGDLRKQLAQKLSAQNEQLKQMLKRFVSR